MTKTQTAIVVESRWKLRRDESGKPKSVLMVNKDITHTRKLEAGLLRAQRIETAGRLVTSIAHDLNNVLSAMLISMRALSQQIDPARRDALKVSQLCAEQAAQLITQLLSLTKGVDQESRSIDLRGVIRKAAKILRSTLPQSIKIAVPVRPDLHRIAGNPTQLCQLLLNLGLNARDAMPGGGTLMIEAGNAVVDENAACSSPEAVPGEYVLLSVADTALAYLPISPAESLNHFLQRRTRAEIPALDYLLLQRLLKTIRGSLIYRRSLNAVHVS